MSTLRTLAHAGIFSGLAALQFGMPAHGQTAGKDGTLKASELLTKESLFTGTNLSAENQNIVLGNLLKHYDQRILIPKEASMKIPESKPGIFPDLKVFGKETPDPCASNADAKQLAAMHQLLATTMSARPKDVKEFNESTPKGCDLSRLRYYLSVTAKLFPEENKK
jgi:hypothetical protein